MNKKRQHHREINTLVFALAMANGLISPNDQFFKDVTDGESESCYLKGLYEHIAKSKERKSDESF